MPSRTRRQPIPPAVRREVLNAECAYCGFPYPTEVDHVMPFSRGGTDERSNLAPACEPCNREKLDSTPEEWRAWRESKGMEWPPIGRHGLVRRLVDEALASGRITEAELDAATRRMFSAVTSPEPPHTAPNLTNRSPRCTPFVAHLAR